MPESLAWFELTPPAQTTAAEGVAVLRPLASRPRRGLWRQTPTVVLEWWATRRDGQPRGRWLLGLDNWLVTTVPAALVAQLPNLGLRALRQPQRIIPALAMPLRLQRSHHPLRPDVGPAVAAGLQQLAAGLHTGETVVVQWVLAHTVSRRARPEEFVLSEALGFQAPAAPSAAETQAWKAKVAEPLFSAYGRLGVDSPQPKRTRALLAALSSALQLADSPQTGLVAGRASTAVAAQLATVSTSGRRWASLVNASELTTMIGWPVEGVTVVGSSGLRFGRVPRPLLLRKNVSAEKQRVQRVLGESLHPADDGRLAIMPPESITTHLAVIGPTGSGKSTALAQLILADAAAGRSVLVVEPRGSLVEDVLERLPAERLDDVVLIEPGDSGPVVGLNPLAGAAAEAERRADELLSLFRALFGTAIGPRSADVLLHALITAARLSDGTLIDVPVLLTNAGFRRQALNAVNDPLVLQPFWAWFDGLSQAERGQVIAPIMNKLRPFVSRAALRRLLGQPTPRFSLEEVFSQPRIVLVNLNRGLLGPETARLLGAILLSQVWQIIQRRAAVPRHQRPPVMVVVDEWQDYLGALDFGEVLAQARGLGVGFALANQHLDQLGPSVRAAALANARSRLIFQPSAKDATELAAVLGGGLTADDLKALGAYQACVRLHVNGAHVPPFGVRTLPLPPPQHDLARLRQAARQRDGVNGDAIDAAVMARWQHSGQGPGPIGVSRRRSP